MQLADRRGWLSLVGAVGLIGLLCHVGAAAAGATGDFVIARNGHSDALIVVAPQAGAVETTAAKELQSQLAQVTGATLPIVSCDRAPGGVPQILVGPSPRLSQAAPQLNLDALPADGIVIRTLGDRLILSGRPPRGTLYAVYTFLEDTVGCRWWTPTESFVPRRTTLAVAPLDVNYAPPISYREAYYRDAFEGVFAARSKCNGDHERVLPEYGGHQRFALFVHTFYQLLPPERYFHDHPDWYSEIKGQRTAERAQLCLANADMRRELVKNALERLRKVPDAGYISISQNDWHNRCQCPACRAAEAEEGSPSGPLLRFVNAVAQEIEKEFPRVMVETLAYQYTRQPPKLVRPRHNVVVRLCSIECSFTQPLSAPENETFRRDIEGWSRIAPQLFIWDYVTNFSNYILPHPNLRVLASNIRFFADHKTIGLFEQGDAGSGVGDFVRLRAWLLAHLMWNPRADEKALRDDFLRGYYGPAAPHLAAYLDTLLDRVDATGAKLGCYQEDTSRWLDLATLNRATRLWRQAEALVVGDAVLAARLRRERLALDHAWLNRYYPLARQARRQGLEFLGPADPVAAADDYIRTARQFHVGEYREGQPFAVEEERLRRSFRAPAPPPEQCRGLSADDWVDIQDHQFRLAHPGEWATLVDDPAASDGKAARMGGEHNEWAVSYAVTDDLADERPWHCYMVVRWAAKAATGPAMTLGIYDGASKRNVVRRQLNVEAAAGTGYKTTDLGAWPLRSGMYFWAAPPKRPGEVTAVYIDRIFLVR